MAFARTPLCFIIAGSPVTRIPSHRRDRDPRQAAGRAESGRKCGKAQLQQVDFMLLSALHASAVPSLMPCAVRLAWGWEVRCGEAVQRRQVSSLVAGMLECIMTNLRRVGCDDFAAMWGGKEHYVLQLKKRESRSTSRILIPCVDRRIEDLSGSAAKLIGSSDPGPFQYHCRGIDVSATPSGPSTCTVTRFARIYGEISARSPHRITLYISCSPLLTRHIIRA